MGGGEGEEQNHIVGVSVTGSFSKIQIQEDVISVRCSLSDGVCQMEFL